MESKYYKWNKRGSKIIIDTGYKSFDNYIVCIGKGNCISTGQLSFYIRSYNETMCNGIENKQGHLRNYDYSMFSYIPYNVKSFLEKHKEEQCCLYEFFTKKGMFGCLVGMNGNYYKFVLGADYYDKKSKCLDYIIKVLEEKVY